jgi:hypothetical protein
MFISFLYSPMQWSKERLFLKKRKRERVRLIKYKKIKRLI